MRVFKELFMARRSRISYGSSKRMFRNTSAKVHKFNGSSVRFVMRGGLRG